MNFGHIVSRLSLALMALPVAQAAAAYWLPVLNRPLSDCTGVAGIPFTLNLNTAFGSEEIDDHVVRFRSQFQNNRVPIDLDMALFRHRAPVTRANFLKYVTDGDYAGSFIHRSVPGFVIQGGGYRVNSTNGLEPVPTDPPIVNEFGVSNTMGTISMAKLGGDPNSATSQWFVSVGANSDNLDNQNGGFTVFGRLTQATLGNAHIFANPTFFPIYDYGEVFDQLPLFYTHQLNNVQIGDLILFTSVTLEPLPAGQAATAPGLSFEVLANSNPAVASATLLAGGQLQIQPLSGQAGRSTTVTIRARDGVGNTVDDQFVVQVQAEDRFAYWQSRVVFPNSQQAMDQDADGDGLDHLTEYAFFGDPGVASRSPLPVLGLTTGSEPASRYLTLTFPLRKLTSGLIYTVQSANSPQGPWSDVWVTSDGTGHPQVVSSSDLPDRVLVTVRDNASLAAGPRRFLRVKLTQQ